MPPQSGQRSAPRANGSDGAEGALAPAGRGLMKERAYEDIKKVILGGGFPPNSFVAERQLAERLGMSKTPVRAALERLAAEGFVTISPQQGIIIRDMTVHEIADHYEIRVALEGYVLRALAGRLTADQAGRLEDNLREQAALRADDGDRAVALDAAFHMMFCEFLGNQEILRVMGQLREKFQRVIAKVFRVNPGRIAASCGEHKAIAAAVLKGDAARAARLVEEHLEYGKQCLLSPRRPTAP